MQMTIKKYIICLLCFVFHFSFAQDKNVEFLKENFPDQKKEFKDALHNIEDGDVYFNNPNATRGHFLKALELYKKAEDFNDNSALLNLKMGECYLFTVEKLNAIKHLEKAKKLNPDVSPRVYYLLGIGYHFEYDFDRAIDYFEEYKKRLTPEERAEKIKRIQKKIRECEVAKGFMAERSRAFIDNVGSVLNSEYAEHSPIISADQSVMLFTSRREGGVGGDVLSPTQEYFEDVYISYRKDGKWQTPVNMGRPINDETNDATISITGDGQHLFVYKEHHGGGDIYECILKGDHWSRPKRMPKPISSDFNEYHASYSNDMQRIYFISDREGGQGGRDIYMCEKDEKGHWGDAINLGPIVNTEESEAGVFISPDGKYMYFSSRGHNTMGGHDVFRSKLNKAGRPSRPENLGYPINTPSDDVYFVLAADGKHGYYASERLGGLGENDIYLITFLLTEEKPVVINTEDNLLAGQTNPIPDIYKADVVQVDHHLPTILKGTITDALLKKPIEASIELVNNTTGEVVAVFNSNSSTGKYLVTIPSGANYGIAVDGGDDYLFHSENFDIPEVSDYLEIEKDIALKNIKPGNSIVLKNVFFDFNKSTIKPESEPELGRLVKLLTDVPELKIEISGHTDSKGEDAYNQKLSEARAQSVTNYLVEKGIVVDRLTYKGYGESQPIASNDTDEGRQENRRTEFKILSN